MNQELLLDLLESIPALITLCWKLVRMEVTAGLAALMDSGVALSPHVWQVSDRIVVVVMMMIIVNNK